MAIPAQDLTNPGQGPDYRLRSDGVRAIQGLWRIPTPPFLEDGTVPDVRLTVAPSLGITPVTGGGVGWDIRESTFNLTDIDG